MPFGLAVRPWSSGVAQVWALTRQARWVRRTITRTAGNALEHPHQPGFLVANRPRGSPGADDILRGMTTGIVLLDEGLKVLYVNGAAENLLGLSERQATGRPIAELVLFAEELVGLCQRAFETGATYGRRELEVRVGERKVVLDCRAASLDGQKACVLLELFDTQMDRQARKEAELVSQRRISRRIISQLAHEVKNPLGGLRGAAQLLERQLPAAGLKAYTRVIIEEADRLAALVDGILRAGGEQKTEMVNLHQITEHVANLVEGEKPAGVELVRDYDPSLPMIWVDRSQIIQAFLNLAKNALQALGSSGQLVFRTRALSNYTMAGEQHRLVLSAEVEDDGPGIPDDIKETIFYPLVTGRDTGTGLGLTIAQDLVSRNGGLIEFDSRPGSTLFQMHLPVRRALGQGP